MTVIRLAMLARDEADRIAGVAAACGDLVDDYVVLVDRRTTDDTEAAIRRELGDGGRVLPFTFEDFAQARNELFYCARAGLGKEDFILLADPDSPPSGTLPPDLDPCDVWDCEWRMGDSVSYSLPILVRATLDASYVGACHELLHHAGVPGTAPHLKVDVPAKPFNRERAEGYLALLERDWQTDPRAAFYRATTLHDLGRFPEAIAAYLQRAGMLGTAEETYLCLLRAGALHLAYDIEGGTALLERAHRYRPSRLEATYALAQRAIAEGRWADAITLAQRGLETPRSQDRIFVDRRCERVGLSEVQALAFGSLANTAARLDTLVTMEATP